MITRTQVSVDDATREILDKLSTTLSRELPDEIREVLDAELSPLNKRLTQIAIATDGLRGKLDDQISVLTGMQGEMQTQAGRFDEQLEHIAAAVTETYGQVQIAASSQTTALTGFKFELSSAAALIHELHREMNLGTVEIQALRTTMLEVAQQQVTSLALSQTQMISAQRESFELLQALKADMACQHQVLNLVQARLDAMSLPWWKKLFTNTKENKA